ncbi:MAG: tetratricopeptide repeat protein [Thermohalobaculum sp.]
MQVADAFVSGSLGQAVFREEGILRIIDGPDAAPRDPLPNEVQMFRHVAREVASAHPDGLPVQIDHVRARLDEEVRFFDGLDGLLIGMDRDFSDVVRRRAVQRAEDVISSDEVVAKRIRHRFLVPFNSQEWDPAGGLAIALRSLAESVADYYRPLTKGILSRLEDDIRVVVFDRVGDGLQATQLCETILRSGLLAELVTAEAHEDSMAIRALLFRRSEFPKLNAVDPAGQILAGIIGRIEQRSMPTDTDVPADGEAPIGDEAFETSEPSDPILAAVDRALKEFSHRKRRPTEGSPDDLGGIQREVAWIGERLSHGETARAEQALLELIDRQSRRSRAEDLAKTLTAVADISRKAKLFELTSRLISAIALIGIEDATASCVRAETLRDLGRHEEALAAFDDTMRRFPQDVVAPTARAETLRDLGRHEEALAAFEDTMRRFPQDVVAPTACAETLRDLGRHEDALAAFDDTMRRFPQNEVAPTARAETLRDLGRHEEALAAFDDTMRRFPQDVVAPTARAETLRDLGRHEEALAAFDDIMRRFPQNAVAPTACAHLLATCGRLSEAETMLAKATARLVTNSDWIALHIIATARLRAGRVDDAISDLERGARHCSFRDTRRYFETALPLALLAKKRAAEAAERLEAIARNPLMPRREATNIVLFQAHALAEAGEPNRARALVESAQIVDFAAARQRQLAAALTEKYGLITGEPTSAERSEQLSERISTLEFELLRPRLWSVRTATMRAA